MKLAPIKGPKRIKVRIPLPPKAGRAIEPKFGLYDRKRDTKNPVRRWKQTGEEE